jgi:hypothetical protein
VARVEDPGYWRLRAKQRRMIADSFTDDGKQIILKIAEDYERMAANAEERLKLRKQGTRAKHDK